MDADHNGYCLDSTMIGITTPELSDWENAAGASKYINLINGNGMHTTQMTTTPRDQHSIEQREEF